MTANGHLIDANTRHQIYLQRYASGSSNKLVKHIKKAIKAARARLNEDLSAFGTLRYRKQMRTLRTELESVYDDLGAAAQKELTSFAEYELGFNQRLLVAVVKPSVEVQAGSLAQLVSSAFADVINLETDNISIRGALREFTTKKAAQLVSEIEMGHSLGETNTEISRRVRSVAEMQRRHADTIVRTAVNHISTSARNIVMDANADLLEGWQWLSTLDGRTTPICRARDGRIYPLDSDVRPPAHYGCRSTITPVIKPEYAREVKGSERAANGAEGPGTVSSKTTYQTWLKQQPAAFQREVLGATRYNLFAKGDLTLDKFVDSQGHTLSLDQLRQREPQAFERIQ